MKPGHQPRAAYECYLAQDLEALPDASVPEPLKKLWALTWSGQLREAQEYGATMDVGALPGPLKELVEADRVLLSVKIGLGLPQTKASFAWNSFANLVFNYALFSYYFWVDHRQAYRALWRMTCISFFFPYSKAWITGIFLFGHLSAISGLPRLGFAVASLMFRLTMQRRSSGRKLPKFAENIIVAAFPYTNFVCGRLENIPRLLDRIQPIMPSDPYYHAIFQVSCLYAFAYSGDIVRCEIFSSHFQKLNQEKKLLRYRPIALIIALLPFALRGYAYMIEERFETIFKNHEIEASDPAINSQFFRVAALIQLQLHRYDEALISIDRASRYRQQSGFHSWQKIDNQIRRHAQSRTMLDFQQPLQRPYVNQQNAGPHVNYFLTRLILSLKDFISEPEHFKDNLREILMTHFSWPHIIIQKDDPLICGSDPILKVDDHFLVFQGLPDDRASFIREILAHLRPYIISLENSQKQIRDMNERIGGISTMTTIAQTAQMLAHDVRRPFSLTQSLMELLREAQGEQEIACLIQEFGPEIDRSLFDVNSMIADVLEVGGLAKPCLAAVEPAELIEKAVRVGLRRVQARDVVLSYAFHHQHQVLADQHKVSRVLVNIIENAVEAMHGRGRLWVETHEGPDALTFVIGNSGSFVAADRRTRIFTAFYTHGKASGTGLGLAIANKIVIAHGGEIWCESDPETGTRILFTLKTTCIPSKRMTVSIPDMLRSIPGDTKTLPGLRASQRSERTDAPRFALIEDSPLLRYQWSLVKEAQLIRAYACPSEFMKAFADNQDEVTSADFLVVDRHFENDRTNDGLSCIQWLRDSGYAGRIFLSSNSIVDRSILIRMDAIPISKNLKKALPEIASHL
ncbi:MAG TPA: HAMP domain-containing sensor histidine kinase [Oligoflexus sp.]|uniref:sensor histidine kinase n=1 Tax=Oligoflexus sp. TaxID=1971216 RepID=UPI002D4D475B|nr:HAMP domain-containing sensor histidine kinase [Oligoflexus sp.]HYX32897.1 HAMP domain-containing sensor histidine kinase [Oligoflexus sp.]